MDAGGFAGRMRLTRRGWLFIFLCASVSGLFIGSLVFGSVHIPVGEVLNILLGKPSLNNSWTTIVLDFRLPKAITALLAGCGLAVSGLQMQTLFRNPLADPYILGVSSGASLGVALLLLNAGLAGSSLLSGLDFLGGMRIAGAASLGAGLVLGLILLVSRRGRSALLLLVLGIMFSYVTSALVSLLFYFSNPERIHAYLTWSFGSFGGVTWNQMKILVLLNLVGLGMAFFLSKSLNTLLLGEMYARSMGMNIIRTRSMIIISTAILAGTVTAFCGPVAFLGLAVPHLCRALFNTSDHRVLMPAAYLLGGILALSADMASQLPAKSQILPLNAITALIGAPVVIWVLLHQYHFKTDMPV